MKISYDKTTTQRVEIEVPDYYGHDPTPRGKVVDVLIAVYTHRGRSTRDRLYDNDADTVEGSVSRLRESYELADSILAALATP